MAAPTSVAELASSVDLASVSSAVLAVGGAIMALYVTFKGVKFIVSYLRGA